jgi:hypothetical protein
MVGLPSQPEFAHPAVGEIHHTNVTSSRTTEAEAAVSVPTTESMAAKLTTLAGVSCRCSNDGHGDGSKLVTTASSARRSRRGCGVDRCQRND